MDPEATLMNNSRSFQSPPFNLAEIWNFPINAGGGGGGSAVQYSFPSTAPLPSHKVNRTRKRRGGDDDESAKAVSTSGNGLSEAEIKRPKATRSDENSEPRGDEEGNSGKPAEQPAKPAEQPAKPAEPPKDYIHVRARRGQATDSHSLAERARREKISERMKILQDLVPGCNKVIGKALVLDEIINYIQSLQHQVEFLSMKLEAVNSSTPSMEGYPAKDLGQQTFNTNAMAFASEASREYAKGASSDWLHMQLGGGFERAT